jgi:glycosyltransferase involved in cell wall biosynthesis
MHIAEIAPLAESVPPSHYGGTERVVSWLTDELVGLGDKVTLFASGGSKTKAELVPISPKPLRLSRPPIDPTSALTALLECVARRAKEFDVIHCHLDWIHIPLFRRLGRPFVTTLHGRLDLPHMHSFVAGFTDAPFVSISNSQRGPLAELNYVDTIYHGLPERLLLPNLQAGSYLAFLGRFTPEKDRISRSSWRERLISRCASRQKYRGCRLTISRSRSNRSWTAIRLSLSARSMSVKSRTFSAMPWRCWSRSIGPSRSAW